MKRAGVGFFFAADGNIGSYYLHLLSAVAEQCEPLLVVSNGRLKPSSVKALEQIGCLILERENEGYDAWGHKAGIEFLGFDKIAKLDELILFNHTFYGPIFPIAELFDAMEKRKCDFWGISAHAALAQNPLSVDGPLPYHIQSHFIAIRKPMLESASFQEYWRDLPEIKSYNESILKHELVLTPYFQSRGFSCAAYVDPADYSTDNPIFDEVDKTIERRCPILKRRPFFHDPLYHDINAIRLRRAYDLVRRNSTYDTSLIWKDLLTAAKLRTLHTNVELLEILDDKTRISPDKKWPFRIAVLAHIFYPEMTKELVSYADNIPQNFDLIITTDTNLKVDSIREQVAGFKRGNVIIRKVDNRGRDTSALLIASRDIVLSGQYDLVCRIHSKKSPQDGANLSEEFKRHLFDNLLYNRPAVGNILDLFEQNERLGLIIPPVIHIGYPTMGWAWFNNRPMARKVADLVKINVEFDDATPIAAYGGMFWCRPEAIKKLFLHEWQYTDFNEELAYGDGDLPHAIERMYCYVAQDAGYFTMSVLSPRQAARNYVKMEYKLQLLSSYFRNGAILDQLRFLRYARRIQIIAVLVAIVRRFPMASSRLLAYYRYARNIFTRKPKTDSR